ncbi:MAG TPA: hypothetical protein VF145_09585, partial [Chitinophagaceae bacterium]
MRKIYLLLQQRSLLFILFLSGFISTSAQTDISIGTGTAGNSSSSYPAPIQDWYEGGRAQFLYLASELSAAGMVPGYIDAVKFTVTALNGAGATEDMVVTIGPTSATTLLTGTSWNTFSGPTVSSASVDYQPIVGTNPISFSSSFFWNGSDNILIEICNGDPLNAGSTMYTNNASTPWTTGLAFNGSHTYTSDNNGSLCGTTLGFENGTATTRPNITFSWTPASACTGAPDAGTAVSNTSDTCAFAN